MTCTTLLCVLAGVMIVTSLVGFIFGWVFNNNMGSAKCAVATILNDFLEGTEHEGTQWIGINPAIGELDGLKENIEKAPQTIGDMFDNTDWIEDD